MPRRFFPWVALLLPTSASLLHTAPLLRVRGGFQPFQRSLPPSLSTVPTPVLLDEIMAEGYGRKDAATKTAPNALRVFRKVVGFVWVPNVRAQLLVIASLMALVLSKSLNVLVPFTLKRAVDALEASSKATAGSSAIAVAPLLVLYAATRLGVSLANEVSADQYERRKISRVLVSPRNRCAAQALE